MEKGQDLGTTEMEWSMVTSVIPTVERVIQDSCQRVRSQPGLHGNFYPSLSYTVRMCLKKNCFKGMGRKSKEENV